MIAEPRRAGARLVVLTEMFSTGFSMDDRARSPSRSTARARGSSSTRRRRTACGCAGRCPRCSRATTCRRNTLVLAAPDGTAHRYAKIHPFTLRRRARAVRRGRRARHGRRRGRARAASSSVTTCASPTSSGRSPPTTDCYVVVANWPARATRALAHAAAGPGDREPGVRRRREPGRARRQARLRGRQRGHRPVRRGARRSRRADETHAVRRRRPRATSPTTRAKFPFLADRR